MFNSVGSCSISLLFVIWSFVFDIMSLFTVVAEVLVYFVVVIWFVFVVCAIVRWAIGFFVSLSCLVVLRVAGLLFLNLLFACFSGLFWFLLCCAVVWFLVVDVGLACYSLWWCCCVVSCGDCGWFAIYDLGLVDLASAIWVI